MITITFSADSNSTKQINIQDGIPARDIIPSLASAYSIADIQSIVAVKINNEICQLSQPLTINANIEPVLINTSEGSTIYRRTLCFVLAAAAHSIFPGKRLVVGHSLGHGYYYIFDSSSSSKKNEIAKLKAKMDDLIKQDLSIIQKTVSYKEALENFDRLNLIETKKQFKYLCISKVVLNTLEDFSDFYYAPLLAKTGLLNCYDLTLFGDGFLLRFPPTGKKELEPVPESPQLFNIYKKYKQWGKTIGVTSAASLNEVILNRKIKDFVTITETFQNKCFAEAADAIAKKDAKVVLIAGPSSSGKTTSSKKLSQQLQVIGLKPHVISLDDYYVERVNTPRDADGNYDYECLEALDVALLNENLLDLFNGKQVEIPNYDFVEGKRNYNGKNIIQLQKNDILILEGIHGLNDKLTPKIDAGSKFKVYVSALTQLNLDDLNRVSTSDNRLVRRIVRDSQFRGKSAAETISMWPSVHKGERLHIFPFQNNADIMINTALDYELSVLRVYAEPLLRCVSPLQKEYAEATRLLRFLINFCPVPSNFVPGQSLLREFIGGSEFKY